MTISAATLDALLAKHHVDLTSQEVIDVLDHALTSIPGPAPLSAAEVDFLRVNGGKTAAEAIDAWSATAAVSERARIAVREFGSTIKSAVSIKEAAEILGVDRSRVSRRITGNALWAFDFGGAKRIPRWQFLDGTTLPGLEVLVSAIPRGMRPAVLDAFMHTPQPDFDDRTPREYLAGGGDPELVAGFIADLGRW